MDSAIAAADDGRDVDRAEQKLESALFTPGEKLIDGVAIGATRVFIPDSPVEEFFGGEDGRPAGAVYDVRQLVDAGDELATW